MKIKNLAKMSMLGLSAIAAVGFSGCGKNELVTFDQYSGTYENNSYSVAASMWEKQQDEEGFNGVWKLTGNVKYDDNTGKALYYGDYDTKHYVAITIKPDKDVIVENPSYVMNNQALRPFDNGNQKSFTLIKAVSAQSTDFTLTINWNKDISVKYKFILDNTAFTLDEKPGE